MKTITIDFETYEKEKKEELSKGHKKGFLKALTLLNYLKKEIDKKPSSDEEKQDIESLREEYNLLLNDPNEYISIYGVEEE
jgi:mRNA deadenylase 3'-5' endonuclease subunit Ccr4